jgi:hypothetical protein
MFGPVNYQQVLLRKKNKTIRGFNATLHAPSSDDVEFNCS